MLKRIFSIGKLCTFTNRNKLFPSVYEYFSCIHETFSSIYKLFPGIYKSFKAFINAEILELIYKYGMMNYKINNEYYKKNK